MIKEIISSGQPGVERAALDVAIKTELMASCRFVSKKSVHSEREASMVIITKLWNQLRKTHKLGIIK